MRQLFLLLLIIIFSNSIVGSARAATNQEKFDAICLEILDGIQAFHPVKATQMGVHKYDHKLTDWSAKSVSSMRSRLDKFSQKLHRYSKGNRLNEFSQLNYQLIKAEVDVLFQDISKIKWHTRAPQIYAQEAIDGLFSLAVLDQLPLEQKAAAIIGRMGEVPQMFKRARGNLKKVPAINIEIANEKLETAIDFYQVVASELMNKLPERADEILKVSTAAREAMNDFSVFLSEYPAADEKNLAVGKLNYEYKLAHQHFIDFSVDSLSRLADNMLNRVIVRYDEQLSLVMDDHQDGQDSLFVPASFSRQDILDYYRWEATQIEHFLQAKNFLTLPEDYQPVVIEEIPAKYKAVLHPNEYQAIGPFDSIESGRLYVRAIPKQMVRPQQVAKFRFQNRRGMLSTLVREAIPGHHLQQKLADRLVSPVRRWCQSPLFTEGWAEYCEETLYRMGLFGQENPTRLLALLERDRLQIALMVADIKLHNDLSTFDELVDWLATTLKAETESGRFFLRRKLLDIAWQPTSALSGPLGKQLLLHMLKTGRVNGGIEFSLKEFHDRLLLEGTISPALLQGLPGLAAE